MEMKEFLELVSKNAGNVETKETESVLCIGRSASEEGGSLCFVKGSGKDLLTMLTIMCLENSHLKTLVQAVAMILNGAKEEGLNSLDDLAKKYKKEKVSDESEEKSEETTEE